MYMDLFLLSQLEPMSSDVAFAAENIPCSQNSDSLCDVLIRDCGIIHCAYKTTQEAILASDMLVFSPL